MVAGMKLMKPRIDVITLAVADFERALGFYRALGLESSGVIATEHRGDDTHPAGAIVMFQLAVDFASPFISSTIALTTIVYRPALEERDNELNLFVS
jgi:hypothetical protein